MQTTLLLDMAADGFPDRVAVGPSEGGLTFEALRTLAVNAAGWMASQPFTTVAFVGLNSASFPVALYASAYARLPFAPLNYRLPDADLRRILASTAPSLAIVDDEAMDRVAGVEGITAIAASAFMALAATPAARATDLTTPEPDDVAILLFTSGTTGQPKAAMLRHRHLASWVISSLDFMEADDHEAGLVSVPPYHIAGVSAVLTSTYVGRRIVQLEAFTPGDWVRAARNERVTHAMVVPTMLGRVLDVLQESGESLPALRHLSYGGGRMPLATIERAMKLLPDVDFVNAYGLTETSSTISVLSADDHRAAIRAGDVAARGRLASVGRPLPSLEVEIRGPDGAPVAAGVAGEVFVRGDQVSGEYRSHTALREDGWFPTNDCGWLDDDGYLFVDGRLDDVIVRGGENISPGEIEDALRLHPAVADVAVFGLPDDQWGERVACVIVAKGARPSQDDLAGWVKARLRSTKTPEVWAFRDALPYNDTGKLLRRLLKTELSEPVHGAA
jgi:fatty-acyl-CoA synthase